VRVLINLLTTLITYSILHPRTIDLECYSVSKLDTTENTQLAAVTESERKISFDIR